MQIATRTIPRFHKVRRLTFFQFCLASSPLFFGLAIGVLISRGDWRYALALAALPPLVILFFTRPFIGVILWLLLNPLFSALPNPDLYYWVFYRILVPITLCLVILPLLFEKGARVPVRLRPPELVMLALAGFLPVTILLFQEQTRLPLIHYLDRVLIPFLMYLTIRLKPLGEEEFRLVEWTAFFIALSQSVTGLFAWLSPGLLPAAWRPDSQVIISGSLSNPNVYALVLAFSAVLVFQSAQSRRPGIIRSFFLFTSGLSFLCIFLSMERAAWLSAVLVVLGLVCLYPKMTLKYLAIGAVFLTVVGGSLLSGKIDQAGERMKSQRPVDDRIIVLDAMLRMTLEKPLLGWGYDTLDQHIQSFYRQVGNAAPPRSKVTSHNTYLTILTETGMIGFLGYIFPVLYWLAYSLRARRMLLKNRARDSRRLSAFCLAFLMCFSISNFLDLRFFPYALTLEWMVVGFIANLIGSSQDGSNPIRRIQPASLSSIFLNE